jgi:tRNA nucleotidyltransferase/poly(A) polymerase
VEKNKGIYKNMGYQLPKNLSKFEQDIAEDALNRDFTMDALYFDLNELKIIDPLGEGLIDIKSKVIK